MSAGSNTPGQKKKAGSGLTTNSQAVTYRPTRIEESMSVICQRRAPIDGVNSSCTYRCNNTRATRNQPHDSSHLPCTIVLNEVIIKVRLVWPAPLRKGIKQIVVMRNSTLIVKKSHLDRTLVPCVIGWRKADIDSHKVTPSRRIQGKETSCCHNGSYYQWIPTISTAAMSPESP